MTKIRTYKCPGREGFAPHTFDHLHHPSDDPPPRFCPHCGYDSGSADMEAAVVAPYVALGRGHNMNLSAKETYRKMEEGSAERAAMAEALSGEKVEGMKITDLKDNLQYGEIAVKPVDNDVSRMMAQAPNVFGYRPGVGQDHPGAAYAAQAHTGFAPNGTPIKGDTPHAGLRVANRIQEFHRKNAQVIIRSGEQARYTGEPTKR